MGKGCVARGEQTGRRAGGQTGRRTNGQADAHGLRCFVGGDCLRAKGSDRLLSMTPHVLRRPWIPAPAGKMDGGAYGAGYAGKTSVVRLPVCPLDEQDFGVFSADIGVIG